MARKAEGTDIPGALFCDAGYLIAYFADQDQYHERARKVRERLRGRPLRLVTSWPTVSEASTLLLYHYGYSHAAALLKALAAFDVLNPIETEYTEAVSLFAQRNRDQKLSFNDLLVSVMVRGRLKNIPVLTFDRDFAKMGLTIFRP